MSYNILANNASGTTTTTNLNPNLTGTIVCRNLELFSSFCEDFNYVIIIFCLFRLPGYFLLIMDDSTTSTNLYHTSAFICVQYPTIQLCSFGEYFEGLDNCFLKIFYSSAKMSGAISL